MAQLNFEGGITSKAYSPAFNNMAYANNNAVLSGVEVSPGTSGGLNIDISSGRVFFGNDEISVSAVTDLSISSNNSGDTRIDIVRVDTAGTVDVLEGTPAELPLPADYNPDDYIALALLTIPDGLSAVSTTQIKDIRVLNIGGSGSGGGTFRRHIEEFTSQTTVTVVHNIGDDGPLVFAYDNSGNDLDISSVSITDANQLDVTFGGSSTGKIIVYGGTGVNNAYYTEAFTSQTSLTINHNLENRFVFVSVVDNNGSDVIPSDITRTDENTVDITFGTSQSGTVFIAGGISTSEEIKKQQKDSEIATISVTTSSSSTTLSLSDTYNITLINNGSTDCYFDFAASATVADGMFLKAGQSLTFEDADFTQFSAITNSGSTTLKILGTRGVVSGQSTTSEILTISATTSTSTVSFADSNNYKDILVKNISSTDVYVELDSTATTADGIRLAQDDTLVFNKSLFNTFAAITSSGTATVKIIGIY